MTQCGKGQKDVHRGFVCSARCPRKKTGLAPLIENSLRNYCKNQIFYVWQNKFKYLLMDDFVPLISRQPRLYQDSA